MEARGDALVEETVAIGDGLALTVLRPRDAEGLLDEHAFEQDEFMPYWAELWPSGVALARALAGRALKRKRVLELGCGLGLPSIVAALGGGRVLATDWSVAATEAAAANARLNGAEVSAAVVDWSQPRAIIEQAPWDLVLAADVLYERRNVPQLLELLPRLVDARGEVWLADPGRATAAAFWEAAEQDWLIEARAAPVFRLRRRAAGR